MQTLEYQTPDSTRRIRIETIAGAMRVILPGVRPSAIPLYRTWILGSGALVLISIVSWHVTDWKMRTLMLWVFATQVIILVQNIRSITRLGGPRSVTATPDGLAVGEL